MSEMIELDEIDSITFKEETLETEEDTSRHYVDDLKLTEAMTVWRSDSDLAKLNKTERPPMPKFVGECVINLASSMIKRHNYVGYSYTDEMVSDAILNCTKYAHNFSAVKKNQKGKNSAFTYLNFIISKSFNNRILKEKKEQFVKYASYSLMGGHDAFGDEMIECDETGEEVSIGTLGNDFMSKAREYELKYCLDKKINKKQKKKNTIDMFLLFDEPTDEDFIMDDEEEVLE